MGFNFRCFNYRIDLSSSKVDPTQSYGGIQKALRKIYGGKNPENLCKELFNLIFVPSQMYRYPKNPEGTQVIVGSMNTWISFKFISECPADKIWEFQLL